MRRLVNGPIAYLADLARSAGRGWSAFFFAPADPTPLGLIRVGVGALLFWNFAVLGLDLHAFLGSEGWVDAELARGMLDAAPGSWSFWPWVPDAWLRPLWLVGLAVLGLFTLGLFSRTAAVLSWVLVVATQRRMPAMLYGFDQVIASWALYLAVTGASGQAVSLDRFLARWRAARGLATRRRADGTPPVAGPGAPSPTVSANLALRLIQLHLCLIYGISGLAKLLGPEWWSGTALQMVLLTPEFRRFDLSWLAGQALLMNLLTHGALLLELSYPVVIWVRKLRPLVLASVVMMHVGIDLTLGLTEFAAAMIVGNLAFCSGGWLRSLVTGRVQPSGKVLYDGACPRCRASVALLSAADPDRVVEPIDLTAVDPSRVHPGLTRAACLRAMHLVRSDGRVDSGFDAVATLARWLPPFWPLGVVGALPGVASLGRRVYERIAAHRRRDAPCDDTTCAVHPTSARGRVGAAAEPGRSPR